MAITLPILSRSTADDLTFQDVVVNDQQLVTEVNDRDDTYKELLSASAMLTLDALAAAGLYFLAPSPAGTGDWVSGVAVTGQPTRLLTAPPLIYFDNDDYTVSSKTQKLRLRCQVAANATAPNINFTFGLYPVTVAGAADTIAFTGGTVVSGSSVAVNTPSASTITSGTGSDFTIPSDGAYTLGFSLSNNLANNSAVVLSAQLQTRHV